MTLILTEVSPTGIVMAADSSVTYTDLASGGSFALPDDAVKLQYIPSIQGGISCWGMGELNGVATDHWVHEFITSHGSLADIREFAVALANALNALELPPGNSSSARLGFHVAGYQEHNGTRIPCCFHVHDGPSHSLQLRGMSVDPTRFNANLDYPAELVIANWEKRLGCMLRNGDYQLYAELMKRMDAFFHQLARDMGIYVPRAADLASRADYLVFQIRIVSEIYRMSNLVPGIGGGISFLTIDSSGLRETGVKY